MVANDFFGLIDINKTYSERHILAYVYHWSLETINALTPEQRHIYVKMVNQQKEAEAEAIRNATRK